jgi:hypothetical protein
MMNSSMTSFMSFAEESVEDQDQSSCPDENAEEIREEGTFAMEVMTRAMAVQALAISRQDWKDLGRGEDPDIAASSSLEVTAERITALLLVRIVAILSPSGTYKDLSTTTICKVALKENKAWCPGQLTIQTVQELRTLVTFMLKTYQDLPFHNFRHAYHVTISANKLMDLMLCTTEDSDNNGYGRDEQSPKPPTFGLRDDPCALAALIFAALIHDAEHKGIANRRMVEEEHELALLYNDQSIHEQRSLHLAFEELLDERYIDLREAMFPEPEDYREFRMAVVNMVMSTDLTNPERTQITKSKFKEAFGAGIHPETMDQRQVRRSSMVSNISMPRIRENQQPNRRGSNVSISDSIVSDVTTDSFQISQRKHDLEQHNMRHFQNRQSSQSVDSSFVDFDDDSVAHHVQNQQKKSDNIIANGNGEESNGQWGDSEFSDFAADSIAMQQQLRAPPDHGRRGSTTSMQSFAADSVVMTQKKRQTKYHTTERRGSNGSKLTRGSNGTFKSFAVDSVTLQQKRQDGQGVTRHRAMSSDAMLSKDPEFIQVGNYSEDDDSLSLTPPSSDDENDDALGIQAITLTRSVDERFHAPPSTRGLRAQKPTGSEGKPQRRVQRRASTGGSTPSMFEPLQGQRIDEEEPVVPVAHGAKSVDGLDPLSSQSMHVGANGSKFSSRLSICRSIDLSGESIEVYSRRGRPRRQSMDDSHRSVATEFEGENKDVESDEPDQLRESVVLDLLLRVADVGHTLQSWDNMIEWSGGLFHELMAANKVGRGHDPRPGWFDNQVRIMESYVVPLTVQLYDIGVFGPTIGSSFGFLIEENHDQWHYEGYDLTEAWVSQEGLYFI